ncbi:hypothetical protein JK636_19845 [Clostridium sp. YIM B02515]|uniref:Uncharacterized protein n=1 Tax=Clostridium rhizosphaerae TaxID=2803861 RepID=A0ABS1TF20_9CLOT|nr:hypothetical protein [Clostridium rhizosphaerae]MBL4937967.1 hypothetical protein [Clostridium rhizosphaerae]
MSIKEKFSKYYTETYLKRYGDRITQVQGNVVSAKIEEKTILWIFHKLTATLIVKPDRSKTVVKCFYKKNKWFKKPSFIAVNQGNLVIIQGLKGKKGKEGRELISIMNVRNLTTKKDLIPVEGKVQRIQKVQRIK